MSKSTGKILDPVELAEKYGSDAVRYSLLRCSTFEDSDYSEEILIERNNNELANKLGNLVSRVSTLAEKYGIEKTDYQHPEFKKTHKEVKKYLNNYELDKALNEIFSFIDYLNTYAQSKRPWESRDRDVLYNLSVGIRNASILLWPFIPKTSEKIAKQFGFKVGENSFKEIEKPLKIIKIKKSEILFKKI